MTIEITPEICKAALRFGAHPDTVRAWRKGRKRAPSWVFLAIQKALDGERDLHELEEVRKVVRRLSAEVERR